jgi:hypothetical protein
VRYVKQSHKPEISAPVVNCGKRFGTRQLTRLDLEPTGESIIATLETLYLAGSMLSMTL